MKNGYKPKIDYIQVNAIQGEMEDHNFTSIDYKKLLAYNMYSKHYVRKYDYRIRNIKHGNIGRKVEIKRI